MNKNLYKLPLKLTGDRILFIIITWIFTIPLTFVLDFILGGNQKIMGLVYSVITAIPYLMLIYYEAFDAGQRERNKECADMKNALLYCILFQLPSLILFALYLLSFITKIDMKFVSGILGGIWLAPFMGPRGFSETEALNILQYSIFILLESGFFLFSYYLGMKDILLIKGKKKSSQGFMKK